MQRGERIERQSREPKNLAIHRLQTVLYTEGAPDIFRTQTVLQPKYIQLLCPSPARGEGVDLRNGEDPAEDGQERLGLAREHLDLR